MNHFRNSIFASLALLLIAPIKAGAIEEAHTKTTAAHACTDSETWTFSSEISDTWRSEFTAFVDRKRSPVRGFSQGLALRRQSTTQNEVKLLGEYWISRALFQAKLYHIAQNGFNLIAAYPVTSKTAGIQLAALECLSQLQEKFGAFAASDAPGNRLAELQSFAKSENEKESLWDYSGMYARYLIGENRPKAQVLKALDALKGAGAHEQFAKALWAAKNGNHKEVVANLKPALAAPKLPESLQRYSDQARILLARSLYSVGDFEQAAAELKHVKKSSNELSSTLEELSWAFLMHEKYGEAIGTAMNLQAGGMRHTFAPEAPMVMAMALNEICQYPESLRAVSQFRKQYEKPFRWLEDWHDKGSNSTLYPLAVKFLKKEGDLPVRVGTEWVRSPVFLASQEEINLLYDEKDSATSVARVGAKEQRKLALDILSRWRELKGKIKQLRAGTQTREPLPTSMITALKNLKSDVTAFRRFWNAAPAFHMVIESHEERSPKIKQTLVSRINGDLTDRSRQMYLQLAEVAENNQLIEVEIYSGASQDIIWQNAHPDYKELAKNMKDQAQKQSAEKVWDWGRAPAMNDDGNSEIWEDELGSFKADMYDNCSSKDKYLAIRRKS